MIISENIDKLCELVINGEELTTKKLNENGFSSKNITELIEKGYLIRIKRGYYNFYEINSLILYGKRLLKNNRYSSALECFETCYGIDPNNKDVNMQLFLCNILIKNYIKALKYLENLYVNNQLMVVDYNFYIFLLNFVIELPNMYREYAKNLGFDDLMIDYNEKFDNKFFLQNKVRLSVFNQRFILALKQYNEFTKDKTKLEAPEIIIKKILRQLIEIQIISKEKILGLIKNKKYEEVKNYLNNLQTRYNLSISDKYILILIDTLLDIKTKKNIFISQVFTAKNVFEAIDGKNYKLALSFCEEYNTKNTFENCLKILLLDIEEEINNIKNKKIVKDDIQLAIKEKKISVDDIINNFKKNEVNDAIDLLKNFLESINKSQYIFLVLSLIKISILGKDNTFIKPINLLMLLSKDEFKFDINEYISEFYKCIEKNNLELAKIYMEIISNSNFTLISELEKIVSNLEENNKKTNNVKIFIEQQLNKLYDNGIVILEPVDEKTEKEIHDYVKKTQNIVSFNIGELENKRIVLRHKVYKKGFIDIAKLIEKGKIAYAYGDFNQCIELYREVIEFGKPKASAYAKLGLAYLNTKQNDIAIDYLTVATELSKQEDENKKWDFTELIKRIKLTDEDKNTNMVIDNFKKDRYENYGIVNIKKIFELVLSGVSINEACNVVNLNNEQKNIVLLIFAREYYSIGNYIMGDSYMKLVEKTKNKSNFIKSLFEEIRINKKFYRYRVEEEDSSFLLTKI